jgi:hypothetical protein
MLEMSIVSNGTFLSDIYGTVLINLGPYWLIDELKKLNVWDMATIYIPITIE